jgi:uncharacterized membrane protein
MSYVGYGQSPYVPEAKVRLEAIGEAWNLVREKMGVWIPATLIVGGGGILVYLLLNFLVGLMIGGAGGSRPTPNPGNPFSTFTPVMIVGTIVLSLVNIVIVALVSSSLYRLAIKQVRGENIELSDAFKFGDNIGNVIITNLLVGVITTIGTILCYIPGIIAALGTTMALPLAVDRGLNGTDPVTKSWEKLKGQLGNMFVLALVLGLIMMVSIIPLGLGLLVTTPLYFVALAIVYRDLFDTEPTLRGPQLDIPLPPPSAYGTAPGLPGQPAPYGQNPSNTMTPGMAPPPPPPPGQNPPPPAAPDRWGRFRCRDDINSDERPGRGCFYSPARSLPIRLITRHLRHDVGQGRNAF